MACATAGLEDCRVRAPSRARRLAGGNDARLVTLAVARLQCGKRRIVEPGVSSLALGDGAIDAARVGDVLHLAPAEARRREVHVNLEALGAGLVSSYVRWSAAGHEDGL